MDEAALVRARLGWVRMLEECGDAGLVCRRCGVSRPTLRKWWRRYQEGGEAGLASRSRRPKRSPGLKLTASVIGLVMELRTKRRLGPKGIQSELQRLHGVRLSTATIWKVLDDHAVPRLSRAWQRPQPRSRRYQRAVPGERVQLDTMKIAPGLIQFTAIDDCTRLRVLGLYLRRTAVYARQFLEERVLEEFPFPVQRIQTDRGGEFFGQEFQLALRANAVKFRPIRPRSPHLNGKVERSQQTDLREFWPSVSLDDPRLAELLEEWQFYYNWFRPHSALN